MKKKDEAKESTRLKESIKEDINLSDLSKTNECNEALPINLPNTALSKPLVNRIMQLFCTGQYNRREIAHILKVSPGTVSKWLSNPDVSNAINEYQKQESQVVDQAIKSIRLKAVQKMNELLDAENEMVQWQAARDILDRTGHKADNKSTVNINVRSFEERLGELVQDVEFTEDNSESKDSSD